MYAVRMRIILFIVFAFVQSIALADTIRSFGEKGDKPELVYRILSQGKILDSWMSDNTKIRRLLINYDQKLYVCNILLFPPKRYSNGWLNTEGFGVECHDNFPKTSKVYD